MSKVLFQRNIIVTISYLTRCYLNKHINYLLLFYVCIFQIISDPVFISMKDYFQIESRFLNYFLNENNKSIEIIHYSKWLYFAFVSIKICLILDKMAKCWEIFEKSLE